MSNENLKIKAPINIMGDLGYVLGTGSGDLGTNCKAARPYALYKPIKHENIGYVTLAERVSVMHSLIPKELSSIRTSFIGSSNKFSTIPLPEAWDYDKPTGGTYPYRVFDFLHIESDLTKIATHAGYNHGITTPPLVKPIIPNPYDITNDGGGTYDLVPLFDYDGTDANRNLPSGTIIELLLNKIWFKGYSGWRTILNDTLYDDIFGGRYRFGIALAIKVESDKYQWCVVGSPAFLSNPFNDITNPSVRRSHAIRLAYDETTLTIIKNALRKYGQTSITCVPFLGVNLYYNASSGLPNKWAFQGDTQLAITFPNGDYFTINPDTSKFPITIDVTSGNISIRAAYTNSDDVTQNVSGLTWYDGVIIPYDQSPHAAIRMPAAPSATYNKIITELTFTITSHFGTSFNFSGGLAIGGSTTTSLLLNADGTPVADGRIDGEWGSGSHVYKIRAMSPFLYAAINGPDQSFPKVLDDYGADLYFNNSVLAPDGTAKLHKINTGLIVNKIS